MSFRKKIIALLIACIVVLSVGGIAVYAEVSDEVETGDSGTYSVTHDGVTLTVDKESLNFSATSGGKTWYSGKRASEEDGLSSEQWIGKLTDAVTVGYRNVKSNSANERPMSLLNATVKFTEKSNGFDAKIKCKRISLTLTLKLRFDAQGITVSVPYSSVTEGSDQYKLQYLMLYPFFDSSFGKVQGKMLLPDGVGATVDLSVSTGAKQPYSARVYGDDYGVSPRTVRSTSPQTASLPMFATMYPTSGTLTTAQSGAEYATINASVSGVTTNYNTVYFTYHYRETFVKYYQSAGSEGKSYVALQEEPNQFDIEQRMTFLGENATVVDVANAYQKQFPVTSSISDKTASGLRLRFLMSEAKQGMFGNETLNMTTTQFVQQVIDETLAYTNNLSVSLYGYTKGGYSQTATSYFPLDGKSGGKSGYADLFQKATQSGVNLSMHADFSKVKSGLESSRYELALNLSDQYVEIGDNRVGSDVKYRLLSASYSQNYLSKNNKNFQKYCNALDLESIGYLLFSHTDNKVRISRTQSIEAYQQALDGLSVNLYRPNAYLWNVCADYLDMPLYNSGYVMETESVPLLPILLSGKKDMYCSPLNLNYSGEHTVLKLIDYNVYPSFLLTEQDSVDLHGTESVDVFTSEYDDWKTEIQSIYQQVNGVLQFVRGATVVNRVQNSDYAVTEYSNGVKIAVNYSNQNVVIDGITVGACSAQVIAK